MELTRTLAGGLNNNESNPRLQLPQNAENVEHMFECPVCTEFMIGLVHICVRGHGLCETCYKRVKSCPMCRGDMSAARNQFLESFIDHCSFRCRFAEHGCKDMIEGHAYNIHIKECNYREIDCDLILGVNCGLKLDYNNFIPHLKSQHKIRTLKNNFELSSMFHRNVSIDNSDLPFGIIEYDNKIFFYNCAKCTMENERVVEWNGKKPQFFLCWWVSVFGTDEERRNYYYTVTLRSRHDKGVQYSWTGLVQNFRFTSHDIYSSKDRLAVSSSELQSLCLPDLKNPYYIHSYVEQAFVFKRKDPGTDSDFT